MSNAMDFASGVSAERRHRIQNDTARDILGDINSDYAMAEGLWNAADLGDAFRQNVVSDIPVLLVHGTWDTATPIENGRDVVASLENGHLIEVVGGTHGALYNLYEHWPPMRGLVRDFMTGKSVEFPDSVEMPALKFPERSTTAQKALWDAAKSGDVTAVRRAISAGQADELCQEIAERLDTDGLVEVVTESYAVVAWFDGENEPAQRVVHATCEPGP